MTEQEFKEFIELKFNKVLKEEEYSFLYKYIIKGKNESEILPAQYKKVEDFYKEHKDTENIKIMIQKIKNQGKDKAEFNIDKKYEPVSFLKFYYLILKNIKNRPVNTCYYCGVSEDTCKEFCEKRPEGFNKRHRGFVLEIEKKDPRKGYNKENCDLACYICNNAKSDLFTEEEFRENIVPQIEKFWENFRKKSFSN